MTGTYIIIAVIIIVVPLVVKGVMKMSEDYARDREYIRERGGMRKVYTTLIDGILENQTAKVEEEDETSLLISGEFVSTTDGSKHGTWTVKVKHTFNVVHITYDTKIYFNDVVQGNKRWEFPITADQQIMLDTIGEKMSEAAEQKLRM